MLLQFRLLSLVNALCHSGRLMEPIRPDPTLKELVEFGSGAASNNSQHQNLLYEGVFDLPISFRNYVPHNNGKWQTNTSKEPRRLKTPIPLIVVDHIWDQNAHDYTNRPNNSDGKS